MQIKGIVLTGGPCAGKTSIMAFMKRTLTDWGYLVFTVGETATEFHDMGFSLTEAPNRRIQAAIAGVQLAKEMEAIRLAQFVLASSSNSKGAVVLFDRGMMDLKAYSNPETWTEIVGTRAHGREQSFVDRYSAVIFLETAAKGTDAYSLESNIARSETADEAIANDTLLHSCWTEHRDFHHIPAEADFYMKKLNVLRAVKAIMGLPVAVEAERKWLVKPVYIVDKIVAQVDTSSIINQSYLRSAPGISERVRKTETSTQVTYTHTIKRDIAPGRREEFEEIITEDVYDNLLAQALPNMTITKNRYVFIHKDKRLEVDHFLAPADFWMLEREGEPMEAEADFPSFITVLEEVTENQLFRNDNISLFPSMVSKHYGSL